MLEKYCTDGGTGTENFLANFFLKNVDLEENEGTRNQVL